MSPKEEILTGGRSTASVVKIGNIVHRSVSTNAEFIHAFLLHLEQKGFKASPRFLGFDKKGREKLTYIEGSVPIGILFSDQQLIRCVQLLRELHDCAASSELCGQQETICHNDFAPWNLIFKKELPVGIIDFDDALPGSRIDDLAYFLWTTLELGENQITDNIQFRRIEMLCKVYKLSNKSELANALLRQQERILHFRRNIAENEKDRQKREFSAAAVYRIKQSMQWVRLNQAKINTPL